MEEILKLKKICKIFPGVRALHNVDLQLFPGEVHAIVGENGAGKSTLIKIISGVYKKDAGEICFEGKPVEINSPRDAITKGISTIHQEFNLIPNLDAGANIFLGREPSNMYGQIKNRDIYDLTRKLFNQIGARIDPGKKIKDLGVAEKQQVEICKALSINAKILIMDEPTATLSESEINNLFTTIETLKSKGLGIIYISHRLDELFRIANRATVLRDGEVVGVVNIKKSNKEEITGMMIGRDLKEQYPKYNQKTKDEVFAIENLSQGSKLSRINLKVNRGEILGIAGLVGAGRTELARAIFGVDSIDSGEIILNGQKVKINSPQDAKNKGIVLIPEDRKTQGLILCLPVDSNITISNLDLFSRKGIIRSKDLHAAVLDIVKKLRIKPPNPKRITSTLSGGNQQKVVIAKWMLKECKVFIFDEPTRGVDVGAKVEIYKVINELANQGAGIIMISSDLPELLGISDRILVMKEGKIVRELDRAEATEQEIIKNAL